MSIFFLIVWAFLLIVLAKSIKIIKEHQRAAVFRLGKLFAVRGPGLIWLIPIVEKAEIVDLNKWVPGWQGLSKTDLDGKVRSVALSNPGNRKR